MTTSDTFCLKWNEFEKNITDTLKDVKDDADFYDVTLACEDQLIQAHKLIISACSPFFRHILKLHRHNVPLLYLKGVRHKDMVSLLTFMYHGEVNVAQDDINRFLATAEELKIKGLTHKDKDQESCNKKLTDQTIKIKSEPSMTPNKIMQPKAIGEDSITNDLNTIDENAYDSNLNDDIADYGDFGQETGHRWNETSSTPWNTSSELRPEDKQFPCPICNKVFSTRGSLASHKYAYHKDYSPSQQLVSPSPLLQPNPMQLLDFQMEPSLEKDKDIECPICHKYFSTKGSLATHKYNYHRNSNSLLQQ